VKNYFWDIFLHVFLIPFEAERPGRLSFKPLLGTEYYAVWHGIYIVCIVYIEVYGRRTWSDSLTSSPAAHAGLRRPWENTDWVSQPHFVALMFSVLPAFSDNLLSLEKSGNSPQPFTETLRPAQPTLYQAAGGLLPNRGGQGEGMEPVISIPSLILVRDSPPVPMSLQVPVRC